MCEGALKHEFGKTGRYGRKLRGGRWLITSKVVIPLEHSKRDARGQEVEHGRPFGYILEKNMFFNDFLEVCWDSLFQIRVAKVT